jgi:circadian clock protein KaiC
MPWLHTFRINKAGLQVFPRIPEQQHERTTVEPRRLPTGVPGLDELMGGGIPAGDVVLFAGPTGAGKSTIASQFVSEGGRSGDAAVIAVFEEYPERYLARAKALGSDLGAMVDAGTLRMVYIRPLDLSVDETLAEILATVQELRATRVVIDSLYGFEIALAPMFREDFRESLYRLVGALTAVGVTVLMTTEVATSPTSQGMGFTDDRMSFISDNIVVQRYTEMEGQLRTILSVVKMRRSAHSRDFHEYELTQAGAVVGEPLRNVNGILSGSPTRRSPGSESASRPSGLTSAESAVLRALIKRREASAADLQSDTGMRAPEMTRAVERLLALEFAQPVDGNSDRYRAIARSSKG